MLFKSLYANTVAGHSHVLESMLVQPCTKPNQETNPSSDKQIVFLFTASEIYVSKEMCVCK